MDQIINTPTNPISTQPHEDPSNDPGFLLQSGPNVLLMGPAGSGKTHSIGTLVDMGINVRYLALENGLESLIGYWKDRKLPVPKNLAWHVQKPPKATWADMISSATDVNTLSLEILSKKVDPNRGKYNGMMELLKTLSNFVDDRTGESLGSVDSWDDTCAIVIDGLTGINNAALSLVVGGKPVRNQSDWGIAQNQVEPLIAKLCNDCSAWFILIAHVERETDQILGGVKLTVSTLGKALAPKIPPMFSDVILTVREGTTWTWDTGSSTADVKARNLPFASKQQPNFKNIYDRWMARRSGA